MVESSSTSAARSCDSSTSKAAREAEATPDSGRLLPPQSVIEPRTFTSLPFIEDAPLQQRLKSIVGAEEGSTAYVVKDLHTGRGASLNRDASFNTASLFKLFVMFEVMHQESVGLLHDSRELTMTPYYDDFGLGPRATSLCQQLTVHEALQAMMSVSDNAAAVLLQDLVGSPNIVRSMKSIGLTQTAFQVEGISTSAADTARLLEGIGRRQLIDPASSDRMILLMAQEQFDNGLRAGLPKGAVVAHKTGNYAGVTNDAGIVFTPKGAYVIVVLSTADNATSLIKRITTETMDYFE